MTLAWLKALAYNLKVALTSGMEQKPNYKLCRLLSRKLYIVSLSLDAVLSFARNYSKNLEFYNKQ